MAGHTSLGDNCLRCHKCGGQRLIDRPLPLHEFGEVISAFAREHEHCEQSELALGKRMDYTNADEWESSWDTGMSAKFLLSLHRGHSVPSAAPHDGADLGRCIRFLALDDVDEPKVLEAAAISSMAWFALKPQWPELKEMYWNEDWEGVRSACSEALDYASSFGPQ